MYQQIHSSLHCYFQLNAVLANLTFQSQNRTELSCIWMPQRQTIRGLLIIDCTHHICHHKRNGRFWLHAVSKEIHHFLVIAVEHTGELNVIQETIKPKEKKREKVRERSSKSHKFNCTDVFAFKLIQQRIQPIEQLCQLHIPIAASGPIRQNGTFAITIVFNQRPNTIHYTSVSLCFDSIQHTFGSILISDIDQQSGQPSPPPHYPISF